MPGSKAPLDISYVVLRPHQLAEVHRLMYQSFHLDEPMTSHLKLCRVRSKYVDWTSKKTILWSNVLYQSFQGVNSIPDSDAMVDSLVRDHNLSLMAEDRVTKTPLAVMLNGVFQRSEIDTPPSEVANVIRKCIFQSIVRSLLLVLTRSSLQ